MKNISVSFTAILFFAVTAFAQIEGRVTDAKGNGVSKVAITATGADGAVASTTTTDEDGEYAFEDLDDGTYKITAKGTAAFQTAVRDNVKAAEDETTRLDITLIATPPAKPTVKPTPGKPIPAILPAKPSEPCRNAPPGLIVSNLSADTNASDFVNVFTQVGTVVSADLVEDPETGRSRLYGYVQMSDIDETHRAVDQFNGAFIGGRNIRVTLPVTLLVSNLSDQTRDSDLEDLFRRARQGVSVASWYDLEVASVKVQLDANGRSKGRAEVVMFDRVIAYKAVERFNGSELHGRKIKVSIKPEPPPCK